MFRNLFARSVNEECPAILETLNVQVRWRRKPRWLGTAKTKVFRVAPRTQQDPDERAFMMKMSSHYRSQMKGLRAFLRVEVLQASLPSTTSVLLKSPEQLQAEFDEALKINSEWNAECAKIRARRIEKQLKEQEELVLEKLAAKEEREEEIRKKVRQAVELQKFESTKFITEENIDEAIEKSLANEVDYNFAIDLEGNMIQGSQSYGKRTTQ
ncbi:small ribosomal subunit protein mS26 [Culicoides brevitarsis]|uniref:small ribosomal subunit protein mS26 n=1 Tax=Culicoides brevitarsis TaxID=469753 RepID=UPI00307BC685